jgi:hypothetical protein
LRFFVHVSALLDKVRHQLEHALVSRMKQRILGSVLAQHFPDLLVLVIEGPVEGSSPFLYGYMNTEKSCTHRALPAVTPASQVALAPEWMDTTLQARGT